MYNELNIYSNKRVSLRCSQFSLFPVNKYKNIISAGALISSVKNRLLILILEKLFINIYYFHPALSKIFTAALLFCPKVLIEIVSSLNVPHEDTSLDVLTPFNTGYS